MNDPMNRLNNGIREIVKDYEIPDYKAFILWYLSYSGFDDMNVAYDHIYDGSRDKGIDAIYHNKEAGKIVLIQSKYHREGNRNISELELKKEIEKIKDTIEKMKSSDEIFDKFLEGLKFNLRREILKLRNVIKNYPIEIIFITSFKIDKNKKVFIMKQLKKRYIKPVIISSEDIPKMINDWEAGVAPYIPEIQLPIQKKLHESEKRTEGKSSLIISTKGNYLSQLYKEHGNRIFARNIRLDLGKSAINKEIEKTIKEDPKKFFLSQ